MNHAVDLDGGDGGALQRRQENTAQAVAQRHTETAFERFGYQTRLAVRVSSGLDQGLLGTDELVPVSFDHVEMSLETQDRRTRNRGPARGECGTSVLRRADAWAAGNRYAEWGSRRGWL